MGSASLPPSPNVGGFSSLAPPPPAPPVPVPPPPFPGPGRRRAWWTVAVIAAVIAVLGVVAALLGDAPDTETVRQVGASSSPQLLFEEDFSDPSDQSFSLDVDQQISLSYTDGYYRMLIKQPSSHSARHIFEQPVGSLRFEATVTGMSGADSNSLIGVGCWSGNHSYVFAVSPAGRSFLIEPKTQEEPEGTAFAMTEIEPWQLQADNRLRIDCEGGGSRPTIVTGWANGEPVLSISVPDGLDSFEAGGFSMGTYEADTEYRADDVVAYAERPTPPIPPIDVYGHSPLPSDELKVFEKWGMRFSYPASWMYEFRDGAVSMGGPSLRFDEQLAAWRMTNTIGSISPGDLEAQARDWLESWGDKHDRTLVGDPVPTAAGGVKGFRGRFDGLGESGQPVVVDVTGLVDREHAYTYVFVCQYEPVAQELMQAACADVLDSLKITAGPASTLASKDEGAAKDRPGGCLEKVAMHLDRAALSLLDAADAAQAGDTPGVVAAYRDAASEYRVASGAAADAEVQGLALGVALELESAADDLAKGTIAGIQASAAHMAQATSLIQRTTTALKGASIPAC